MSDSAVQNSADKAVLNRQRSDRRRAVSRTLKDVRE